MLINKYPLQEPSKTTNHQKSQVDLMATLYGLSSVEMGRSGIDASRTGTGGGARVGVLVRGAVFITRLALVLAVVRRDILTHSFSNM